MTCTSKSICNINKHYIQSGSGGKDYHGEFCGGCPWWVDSDEDMAFWKHLEKLGIPRSLKPRYETSSRFGKAPRF